MESQFDSDWILTNVNKWTHLLDLVGFFNHSVMFALVLTIFTCKNLIEVG